MSNEKQTTSVRPVGPARATVAGAAIVAFASLFVAACGGGADDSSDAKATASTAGGDATGTKAAGGKKGGDAAPVKVTEAKDPRMANAVADSKTTAPIDLLYDLPAKPEVGQPFTVELAVKTRVPADTLDLEVGDSPGIVIEGERVARFPNVEAATPYKFQFQARGDTPGLYYITVVAKLATSVQSEGRAFSVPVVVGKPVAQQKPAPQTDASGQPVQSLPAKED